MKVEEVKTAIHEGLRDYVQHHGFKFRKSDFEYVRKAGEVSHIYVIFVHAMTEWFHVLPAVFVGCPKVNKLFNQGLAREIRVNGTTTGFGVRNEYRERGSYNIDQPEDIPGVIDHIKSDFTEVALPFFARIEDLKSLEGYMNKRCETGLYRPGSVSDACKGLIAAKLCGNPDLETIFKDYYEFCKEAQGPLAAPILQIKEFLEPSKGSSQPIALLGPPRD